MQAQDYATVAVAVLTIIGGFVGAVKWLVKHYLNELKPKRFRHQTGRKSRDTLSNDVAKRKR